MARNPDDDVAEAITKRWASSAALVSAVPGGLEQDRGHSHQPDAEPKIPRKTPYAIFRVEQLQEPEKSTSNRAIHHQKVSIEIRGKHADVKAALEVVWHDPATSAPVFVRQDLLMDGANGGKAMAVLEMNDDVRKDEKTKDSEDIWIGLHELMILHDRSYS